MSGPYNKDSKNLLPRWILANKLAETHVKLETALRLLGESECPHTEDDYKSAKRNGGWFCYGGFKSKLIDGGTRRKVSDNPCPHCKQVKEVLSDE